METRISGNFLSSLKGVKDPFEAQEGRWDFSRDATVKRASSRIEGRISWFFTSCGRKFGVPIELLWGSKGPACVASGESSLHEIFEGPLRIPLQSVLGPMSSSGLRSEPEGSYPVLSWISGFLWSFNRGVRPRLMWRHARPLSSRAVTLVSGILLS